MNSPAGHESLLDMFSVGEDARRCQTVLLKLAEHLNGRPVLTGGLAFSWHMQRHGRAIERRPLNDIDLVVADLAAISPSIREAFLISHFHPTRGRGRVLLQLVDARERVRIMIPRLAEIRDELRTALGSAVLDNVDIRVAAVDAAISTLGPSSRDVITTGGEPLRYFSDAWKYSGFMTQRSSGYFSHHRSISSLSTQA